MRAMRFELDRDVGNTEIFGNPSADALEQCARESGIVFVNQYVTGQHHQSWLNSPDVQIMNVIHARNGLDGSGYV